MVHGFVKAWCRFALGLVSAAAATIGCTPALMTALTNKSPIAVQAALSNGADPNEPLANEFLGAATSPRRTPLQIAITEEMIAEDRLQIVRSLLAARADPNLQAGGCINPLKQSIEQNDADVALALLRAGADPNPRSVCGPWPPITSAAAGFVVGKLDVRILTALLKAGADPNVRYRTSKDAWAPLAAVAHTASLHHTDANELRAKQAIDILLAAGAEVNLPNDIDVGWPDRIQPRTALDMAQGSFDVAKYLAQRGGTSNCKDRCPEHVSMGEAFLALVQLHRVLTDAHAKAYAEPGLDKECFKILGERPPSFTTSPVRKYVDLQCLRGAKTKETVVELVSGEWSPSYVIMPSKTSSFNEVVRRVCSCPFGAVPGQ